MTALNRFISVAWLVLWLIGGGYALAALANEWPAAFGPLLPLSLVVWFGLFFGIRHVVDTAVGTAPDRLGDHDEEYFELAKVARVGMPESSRGAVVYSSTFMEKEPYRGWVIDAEGETDRMVIDKAIGSSNTRWVGKSIIDQVAEIGIEAALVKFGRA